MPNLLLCMTPGVGLSNWKSLGILGRELKIYKKMSKEGWNVKIISFDKKAFTDLPPGITNFPYPSKYLLPLLPVLCKKLGRWADVIKTNQSHHAYFYTKAAKIWKKPILLRCGYVHGEYLETTHKWFLRTKVYQMLEKRAFKDAARSEVPTKELAQWVVEKYGISKNQIIIVPNYVDTEVFNSENNKQVNKNSIITIGRLNSVKRYDLLINACAEIPGAHLTIVGDGPEKNKLAELSRRVGLKLKFVGIVNNDNLPGIIKRHKLFVITSEREGHPKALIEAMSCGMPCVGVDVIGIRTIIENNVNGLLVKPEKIHLTESIRKMLENSELAIEMGRAAREYVLRNFTFDKCFSIEYNALNSLIHGNS